MSEENRCSVNTHPDCCYPSYDEVLKENQHLRSRLGRSEKQGSRLRYALERRHRCQTCSGSGTDWALDEEGEAICDPCGCWTLAEEVLGNGEITVRGPATAWCCRAIREALHTGPLAEVDGRVVFSPEDSVFLLYCPFCGCRLLRRMS